MMDATRNEERRKQLALRRLGSNAPRCVGCGEPYWGCLELHHLANRAYDPAVVILCRNCHRKLSDPSNNDRAPEAPPLLERVGHFLLGLASLLSELIVPKLREFGLEMIHATNDSPPPWGWSPAST